MQADIICVGNELLTGLIENSNAGFLARRLWKAGIPVREAAVVADEKSAIKEAMERALRESDLLILTGGLGPTEDDLTREAVAAILNLPLELNKDWLITLEEFFMKRGIKMPEGNKKQAMVIKGSRMLPNSRGTAPGAIVEWEGRLIVMLPGPPPELQEMFDRDILPHLLTLNSGELKKVKTLKCMGLGESMLEEKIKELGKWEYPALSYIARGYEVDLQIKGSGNPDTADLMIDQAEERIRSVLGEYIFGSDDETLAGVVARLISSRGLTLALAESCSGGLLSDIITDVPGSSLFYLGGVVAYSGRAKKNLLKVRPDTLREHGEVSEETALEMAVGVRELFKSDYGLSITGIAGPDSDQSESEVGLVFIAVSGSEGSKCRKLQLGGGRRGIKERSAQIALDMLRKHLLKNDL